MAAAPRRTVTSAETKEIIKFTQSRKELYPKIKSPEDLKDNKYADLMKPLKKKPASMPKYAKQFFDRLKKLEKDLSGVALNNFTYANAKAKAKPAEKPLFTSLENSINTITTANANISGGATTYLPRPKLNTLFAALSMSEFNSNLSNLNIVNQKFALDPNFEAAASAIMRHILQYRTAHSKQLKEETVYNYLNEVFSADEDKVNDTIDKSAIIKSSLITQSLRAKIDKGWYEYQAYRDQLEKRLKLEAIVNKEKQSILSKPIEYAKSGTRWISQKIQKFRENWAGMDGRERVVAGATLLVGVAWFLNSDNEEAGKLRDALKKAGMLGILYVGANSTAKAFTGRTLTTSLGSMIDDKSGKRDLLKASFNTNKAGAEMINASIAYLGNYDFTEIGSLYMDQKNKYNAHPIPDNLKELPVGGVAEEEMSSNQMYRAVRLVDNKLKKQGSSVEQLVLALKNAKAEAKAEGKKFIEPNFAMIISAILMNQDIKFNIKDNRIELVKTKNLDVVWTPQDKEYTSKWWTYTGKPHQWKEQISGKFPGKKIKVDNLTKLSKNVMPSSRPLVNYMTKERFGRYTQGFRDLYNLEIVNKPGQNVHSLDTSDGVGYMTSKVKINPNLASRNMAYVAAVKNAVEQGVREFEVNLRKNNPDLYNKIKGRIREFIHPVDGVALAPSKKIKGIAIPTKKPQEQIVMLRYLLPMNTKKGKTTSQEYALRYNKEWTQGDMMMQMKETIMKPGDTLSRGDFNTISRTAVMRWKKFTSLPIYDGKDSKYAGAYESFLVNFGLKKSEKTKIDKVLEFYSIRFANSGITKQGLIRYLATHRATLAEITSALGAAPAFHFSWIVDSVKKETMKSIKKINKEKNNRTPMVSFSYFENEIAQLKSKQLERLSEEIFSKFGTVLILACYGDRNALAAIKTIDSKLHSTILNTFKLKNSSTPNPNTTKAQFEQGVLPELFKGIIRGYGSSASRTNSKKAIGGYLAKYN